MGFAVIASAAKQSIARHTRMDELLRRFRLRSSSYGGQVASRNDVRGDTTRLIDDNASPIIEL